MSKKEKETDQLITQIIKGIDEVKGKMLKFWILER